MDGTIGEIRIFAANFAPRSWQFCRGQVLPISQNTALFSILGTNFGGDGSVSFGLPDLQGRTAVGVGQGPGLSPYVLGQKEGVETVSLASNEMPAHSHTAIPQPVSASGITATLYGVNGTGDSVNPGGNYLGEDKNAGLTSYAGPNTPQSNLTAMKAGSLQINVTGPLPTVSIGSIGSGYAHDNIQPSLVLYYIICQYGAFPARN